MTGLRCCGIQRDCKLDTTRRSLDLYANTSALVAQIKLAIESERHLLCGWANRLPSRPIQAASADSIAGVIESEIQLGTEQIENLGFWSRARAVSAVMKIGMEPRPASFLQSEFAGGIILPHPFLFEKLLECIPKRMGKVSGRIQIATGRLCHLSNIFDVL